MPGPQSSFSYRILTGSRCALTRMTGEFDMDAMLDGVETMLADAAAGPDMNCLHDWRGLTFPSAMGFHGLFNYAQSQGERLAGERKDVRVSVLVSDEEAFGVVRQSIALLEQARTGYIERRAFLDLEGACAWVGVTPTEVQDAW